MRHESKERPIRADLGPDYPAGNVRPLVDTFVGETIKVQPSRGEWSVQRTPDFLLVELEGIAAQRRRLKRLTPLNLIRPVGLRLRLVPVNLSVVIRDELSHPVPEGVSIPVIGNVITVGFHAVCMESKHPFHRRKRVIL